MLQMLLSLKAKPTVTLSKVKGTYRLDKFTRFRQGRLVLDIRTTKPCFYRITHPLQFLDLRLEVRFQFILLRSIRRHPQLLECTLKDLDTLRHRL